MNTFLQKKLEELDAHECGVPGWYCGYELLHGTDIDTFKEFITQYHKEFVEAILEEGEQVLPDYKSDEYKQGVIKMLNNYQERIREKFL